VWDGVRVGCLRHLSSHFKTRDAILCHERSTHTATNCSGGGVGEICPNRHTWWWSHTACACPSNVTSISAEKAPNPRTSGLAEVFSGDSGVVSSSANFGESLSTRAPAAVDGDVKLRRAMDSSASELSSATARCVLQKPRCRLLLLVMGTGATVGMCFRAHGQCVSNTEVLWDGRYKSSSKGSSRSNNMKKLPSSRT
jgi:hypothetical protein